MYAVIFKATFKNTDPQYLETAGRLRNLALNKYGCVEFLSYSEGDQELAISYWESEEQIKQWRNDPEHKQAQANGKTRWYESYTVQVMQVVREYHSRN